MKFRRQRKPSILDSDADFICINLGSRGEAANVTWALKKVYPDVYRAYCGDISTHDFGALHGHYMVCTVPNSERYIICLYSVVGSGNNVIVDLDAFRSALSSAVENVLVGWQRNFEKPFSVAVEVYSSQQQEMLPVVKEFCASLSGGVSIHT